MKSPTPPSMASYPMFIAKAPEYSVISFQDQTILAYGGPTYEADTGKCPVISQDLKFGMATITIRPICRLPAPADINGFFLVKAHHFRCDVGICMGPVAIGGIPRLATHAKSQLVALFYIDYKRFILPFSHSFLSLVVMCSSNCDYGGPENLFPGQGERHASD